ncbi:hypothetical protein LCGC14_1216060 [marine sediment metagenome]|uniref:Uncharacterized protein n=2 Tax=root TaxID=1 RepID=A0A831QP16_9FLAO|nr:hypothetical protein [Pricia antarctica]
MRTGLWLIYFLICPLLFYGVDFPRDSEEANLANYDYSKCYQVKKDSAALKKVILNLVLAPIKSIPTDASNFALPRKTLYLQPEYPVAQKIVENYYGSSNKTPGGHCLVVSKDRFRKAYEEVYGNPFYEDLPNTIATKQLTPNQVFDNLYITATKNEPEWRNLPRRYRAKGNAGALAIGGLGEIIDTEGIWNGRLRPGALVQVWRLKEDYEKVRRGVEVLDFDPYGHSFIFLRYERNRKGVIEGMRIADQGYQSYRALVPRDYEIWWGVNLKV